MSGHPMKRICIVGCGPAAMSALHHFTNLPDKDMPDIVCYEKQSTWGGMWNLTWRTATDEYGERLHACMYYDLWTNNPKEMTEYPDYTYETHFGKPVPSFFPGPVMKDYFMGRFAKCSKRDLRQFVKFNTVVRWIEYNKDIGDFIVKANNLKEDKDIEERFTHVIVATGLFGDEYMPTFPGLEEFQGQIIHAKEIRRAKTLQGKRVLLIGSSFSAQDLTLQLIKFGASKVIMSYHKRPSGIKFPDGAEERPGVQSFDETTAYFLDETKADIDVVIFCTGYRLHHPFLPENLRMKPETSFYPDNLYKGIVWMKDGNCKFLYLGVLYTSYFLNMLDVQALWACLFIMRNEKPSREDMLTDMEKYVAARKGIVERWDIKEIVGFIRTYFKDLVDATGYQLDVSKSEGVLMEHVKNMFSDYSTYRDKQFRSVQTGQVSAAPTVPWMKDFRSIADILATDF